MSTYPNVATPTTTPTITPTITLTATPVTNTFVPGTPQSNGYGPCWVSASSWPDYTVFYDIETSGPYAVSTDWIASIKASANTWTNVSPSPFVFTFQNGSSNTIKKQIPLEADKLAGTNTDPNPGPYTSAYTKINPNYTWDVFNPVSITGAYSVRNVMTHEFGHWLHLADNYDSASCSDLTMYWSIAPETVNKIDLEPPDVEAVNYQYP